MDAKKTGRLISELRTEKGLTQKELAVCRHVLRPPGFSFWHVLRK